MIATKSTERCKRLSDLGLKYNGDSYVYKDINFHHTDILCMSDDEFEKALEGAGARMEVLKAEEKTK